MATRIEIRDSSFLDRLLALADASRTTAEIEIEKEKRDKTKPFVRFKRRKDPNGGKGNRLSPGGRRR